MPQLSAVDEVVDEQVLRGRAPSLARLFRDRVTSSGTKVAFQFFRPGAGGGDELVDLTWDETRGRVDALAAGLVALGVEPEDRVAIAATTRIEWVLADLAIMTAAAATTTIYPSSNEEDVAYIVADSGSRVVFAEDAVQVGKLRRFRSELPGLMKVVTLDPTRAPDAPAGGVADDDGWVIGVDDLADLGRDLLAQHPTVLDERVAAITPDSLATIIYTSGTTGRPKGVRLPHDAFTYMAAASAAMGEMNADDLQFVWLPLSHVFGKLMIALPLQIGFTTAIDGRIDKIIDNLAVIRPTFMSAAPRIFEKAHARITSVFAAETGVKKRLVDWSLATAHKGLAVRESGEEPGAALAAQLAVADRLVLSKVRERFGGRMRFMISGSAPLSPEIGRWFGAVGLQISEGYGLTETAAGGSVNRSGAGRWAYGSVGWPQPGTQVRFADDGEIQIKGPAVMSGYHNQPEATAEVLDAEGWFSTGDIGTVDERGFIRITDRKKDLFKTSGGKYIAPSMIESRFKALCPVVGQFLVHGESRNFASALITLDPDAITSWAAGHGMAGRSYAQIVASPEVHALVQGYVDELNAGLNRWETIKKFVLLPRDLSVESGDLTPSLKLRRRVVVEKYRDQLDALYR
ncbi:MAG: long-chain fatty acid--CoA ligase [Actinomycetota bacterium]|nr:long-chain fatty acid--CoA ligase [Actinomycetota bacterium]